MKKVELLAPAGNYESLIGALNAGADAVYLGGEKFGARAFAENFTTEQLIEGIKYAHVLGKKIFLTINTLVKEKEFSEIYDYVLPFYEAGLDAVIVQDLGVFEYIKSNFPDMELHVSTQMTITGAHGAKLLAKMGAHRIVPARELSLEEIIELKKECGLEIETFIHGAMCYCYSGQCLFSSFLGGRSGNRGKCAQPCRLPYAVKENGKTTKPFYPLSLKDMCTISQIPRLIEAGIDSFKIEGRMKKPEYVAGVTAIYRKYIDMYYEKPASFKVSQKDLDILNSLYIRSEVLDGYYFRHNGKEMITLQSPSYSGSEEALLSDIRSKYLTSKTKCNLTMKAGFHLGERAWVKLQCRDKEVTVYGDEISLAEKSPITEENIRKGLLALGDTFYACDDFELAMDESIFYSLKAIKELRREALTKLTEVLLPERAVISYKEDVREIRRELNWRGSDKSDTECTKGVRVLFSKEEQIWAYLDSRMNATHLILESELVETISDFSIFLSDLTQRLKDRKKSVPTFLVALPYILRKKDETWLKAFFQKISVADGVLVRNMETYGYLKDISYKGKIYADAGFYVWNRENLDMFRHLDGLCMPLELSEKEQNRLSEEHDRLEQIVYGHMPMMVTANCIAKTSGKCLKTLKGQTVDNYGFSLIDRMNKELPVFTNCRRCYNVIYNSVPLSLHEKVKQGAKTAVRFQFTIESGIECLDILNYYAALLNEDDAAYGLKLPLADYTTGHEKKGAL